MAPAPDGTWLAVAALRLCPDEAGYVSDLWRISVDDPTRPPVQLTRGESNDTQPRFAPDGALLFMSDRNPVGQKSDQHPTRVQVWRLAASGGDPERLTDEPLGVSDYRLSTRTGRLFVIADVYPGIAEEDQRTHDEEVRKRGPSGLHYREMPVRHWDYWLPVAGPHLVVYDADTNERRDLTPNARHEHREFEFGVEWDVDPDGRRAVILTGRPGKIRIREAGLRVIDVGSGESFDLGVVGNTEHRTPRFSPDGDKIACVRGVREPRRAERVSLWLFDELDAASPGRAVAADWDVWPRLWAWTGDGQALLATADHRGQVPIFRVSVDSGEVSRLSSKQSGGSHSAIQVLGGDGAERVIGLRHRLLHPPEPFCMDMRVGAEPALLSDLSGFSPEDGAALARVESFSVPGDAGADVHYYLVAPTLDASEPRPALLWIHGGPMGQWTDGWHWRWNPLVPVAAGYAVVMPNPRGSTGFGQEFIQGIWKNQWGGACYRDIMAVTDAVTARNDIDSERVGAMGGSFGGYMANWIGANTDRFACLITHAGIYALSHFCGVTDEPGYLQHEMDAAPYLDPGEFDRYSPHRRLENWKSPTLIIHGEKDYRVPISEALHLFEALRWRGVPAELLVFPDENHWIRRPQNIRQWYRSVLEFAGRHLFGP